jgi:hypothetical protein
VDILAAFFDPSDNGFDIVDTAQIVGLAVLISGVVAGIFRSNAKRAAAARQAERDAMKRELLDALEERTKPIQPGYKNGGESLADISGLARLLMARQTDVIRDVRGVRERLDHHIDYQHGDKES